MEKKLILNRWRTPDGTVLVSHHTHDYVQHTDAVNGDVYFIDGGTEYVRRSVNDEEMEDMCLYSDSPYGDDVRRNICRGTIIDRYGYMIWIPLCNMSDKHLENCITYHSGSFDRDTCRNRYMVYYMLERLMRWYCGVNVGERTYAEEDAVASTDGLPEPVRKYMPDIVEGDLIETLDMLMETDGSDTERKMSLIQHMLLMWGGKDEEIGKIVDDALSIVKGRR